jgi:UDP-N-acetylmuramoyl-tripeptide--D-alanyl-D-alanine ligase
MPGTNKILLLGSMMELGEESEKEHTALIDLIDRYKWKQVILVGNNFKDLKKRYLHFDDAANAKIWLEYQKLENCQILIKGSRSMQMEKVLAI